MIDPDRPTSQPPPADSGLRCPTCEYNLTGVAENRCPECGKPFDPRRLRAILDGIDQPIPVWEDEQFSWMVRFAKLCLMTWFVPWRIGKRFPECYDAVQTFRFRMLVVGMGLLAYLSVVACSFLSNDFAYDIIALPFVVAGILCGIVLCEALVNLAFIWSLSRPPSHGKGGFGGPRPSSSWRGLIGMFRTHAILSAVVLGGGTTILSCNPTSLRFTEPSPWCTIAALLLAWWWFSLAMAVAARPGSPKHPLIAILMIPVAAALSIGIGVGAGMLAALVGVERR